MVGVEEERVERGGAKGPTVGRSGYGAFGDQLTIQAGHMVGEKRSWLRWGGNGDCTFFARA